MRRSATMTEIPRPVPTSRPVTRVVVIDSGIGIGPRVEIERAGGMLAQDAGWTVGGDRTVQRAGHGRPLERSRYDAEQSSGAQQPGNRQCERAFGHRRKIRKAIVIDLLLAADLVKFNDLDIVRIGEISDR